MPPKRLGPASNDELSSALLGFHDAISRVRPIAEHIDGLADLRDSTPRYCARWRASPSGRRRTPGAASKGSSNETGLDRARRDDVTACSCLSHHGGIRRADRLTSKSTTPLIIFAYYPGFERGTSRSTISLCIAPQCPSWSSTVPKYWTGNGCLSRDIPCRPRLSRRRGIRVVSRI